jgi:hypothetical protein
LKGVSDLKVENKFMANKIETVPDHTGEKQVATRFKPGQSGNPKGRPRGARSKLSEDFVQSLADDFAEHGEAAIKLVRARNPETYLKIIGNVLPRESVAAAFNIDVGKANKGEFSEATSVEDILETVAKEAGPEAAKMLAGMFGIEFKAEATVIDRPSPELTQTHSCAGRS